MTKYVLIGLMVLGACTQEKGWNITIKGKISFPSPTQMVYLEQVDSRGKVYGAKQEVAINKDGTFENIVNVEEPGYFRLNFYGLQQVDFIVNRSDLEINVDGNMQSGFMEVKGSPDVDLRERVRAIMTEAKKSPRIIELEMAFGEAQKNKDIEKIEEIQKEYMDVIYEGQDKVAALLKGQGPSVMVISILTQGGLLSYDRYPDLYDHVAEELQAAWPDYTLAKDFFSIVEKSKKVAVGQLAPEIELPNPDGQLIKLSAFRGKYVLIDFWAKWCAPCRQENPNVVRAYNQYHDKGFEVFGVSLDNKKEDWLQAIEEDGLTWTHVSDLKYFDSQAVADYRIDAIPMSVLVGPDGVIMAKNLRGKSLADKLEEIFGSSS